MQMLSNFTRDSGSCVRVQSIRGLKASLPLSGFVRCSGRALKAVLSSEIGVCVGVGRRSKRVERKLHQVEAVVERPTGRPSSKANQM